MSGGGADNLTREEARGRAERVADVSYELDLDLAAGRPTYRGRARVGFTVRPGPAPLWLDFTGWRLEALSVDGAPADLPWSGHRLTLPDLQPGPHTVEVAWENRYDTTGTGFHRFVDPEDGAEYLYTDFQPYNAHRLFPCFDQPDLKATYLVAVGAPAAWQVLSSGIEEATEDLPDGRVRRRFARTPPFSTYLLAVIAGDYAVRAARPGRVPLRVLCRRSLARYVEGEELLELTAAGLGFYEEFFACPYPFGKYDQVFVPEFNAGAMENVAAVTLGEHLVFRGRTTRGERIGRAETVLHELAHMWFGNLVTLRWWDGLWLNESFATYVSHLALEGATPYREAWEHFRAKIKAWALREDELPSSHPIAGEVADTQATFLNFDGITYGKGAAVLKQLAAYVGAAAFREGLRRYVARHAYESTELADFLGALEEASGRDLAEWARLWFGGEGIDSLVPRLVLVDGRVAGLTIEQEPSPRDGLHRPHRVEVALLREEGGSARVAARREVLVSGPRAEVPELEGELAPDLVWIDHGDRTYAKVVLEPRSLAYVGRSLERVEDPLVRQQVWGTLWAMVRDRRLGAADFLDLVVARLPHEPSAEVADAVLDNARVALTLYVPDRLRPALQARLAEAAWDQLTATEALDHRLVWLRQAVGMASTPADFQRLVDLADGRGGPDGLYLDQPLRWDLLARMAAYEHPAVDERLATERARDSSDKGRKAAFAVEVARPLLEAKERAWALFVEPEGHSDDYLKSGMTRFHWLHQRPLLEPFVAAFFEQAGRVHARGNPEYTQSFFRCLFPPYPEAAVLGRARAFVAGAEHPSLRRLGGEALSELERAKACRDLHLV